MSSNSSIWNPSIPNTITQSSIIAGIISTVILPQNLSCKTRTIMNQGSTRVFLGFDSAAILGTGQFLDAGDVYQTSLMSSGDHFQGVIYAISSAPCTLSTSEGV